MLSIIEALWILLKFYPWKVDWKPLTFNLRDSQPKSCWCHWQFKRCHMCWYHEEDHEDTFFWYIWTRTFPGTSKFKFYLDRRNRTYFMARHWARLSWFLLFSNLFFLSLFMLWPDWNRYESLHSSPSSLGRSPSTFSARSLRTTPWMWWKNWLILYVLAFFKSWCFSYKTV